MKIKTEMTTEIPLEYLVCPLTKMPLRHDGFHLVASDGQRYRKVDNLYWSFLPAVDTTNDARWKMWQELQKNGETSYQNDPENNLGINRRDDHIAFGNFCGFHGLVLDIGSGPQRIPTHFEYCNGDNAVFFGIDVMAGEQPRGYLFVQGLGEYLPFRDNLFDQALFVTSLDHFLDPVEALLEARRAIKADGEICVWIGEKDSAAPRPKVSPGWYDELKIPEGAEDPFHLKRFSFDEFKTHVKNARLKIKDEKIIQVDKYRRNGFFKLVK